MLRRTWYQCQTQLILSYGIWFWIWLIHEDGPFKISGGFTSSSIVAQPTQKGPGGLPDGPLVGVGFSSTSQGFYPQGGPGGKSISKETGATTTSSEFRTASSVDQGAKTYASLEQLSAKFAYQNTVQRRIWAN